ncbi:cell division protein FtsQ/DivIB [Beggiatoa leptomitoformis]|uniref:Cell division protein FtsQ n=1 Tax=Beggiatoa leptomitoformis TaxID=288004 RepID=A0A2N9YCQ7_9GAMM|nr:FtsQ-type POTRA domain-containing protein [Beggiatoa leptomitoformis]ALG66476.1 FtsQ-type POTRA domain-containing protein [Beggiatoa leptomitoformis]AUI68233.1 FtsQ-type POTRA domain-containing protein [Beggiatoa leptomitoformis]
MKKTLSLRSTRRTDEKRAVVKRGNGQARRAVTHTTLGIYNFLNKIIDNIQTGFAYFVQGIIFVIPYILPYWKNIVFVFFLLGLIAGGVVWIQNPRNVPIHEVVIEGNQRVSTQSVREAIAPYVTGSLWQVDEQAIQTTLAKIAWIATVSIERQWMDTLLVKIEEYQAVGHWRVASATTNNPVSSPKGILQLVSEKGIIFEVPEQTITLPQLQGLEDNAPEVAALYKTAQDLLRTKGLQINEFGCNQRYAWYIVLNNGIKLILGRGDNTQRLQRFLEIYDKLTTQFPLCSTSQSAQKKSKKSPTTCQPAISKSVKLMVDLRYTNGVAVRLAQ